MTAARESGEGASRQRRSNADDQSGVSGQRWTLTSRRSDLRGYILDQPHDLKLFEWQLPCRCRLLRWMECLNDRPRLPQNPRMLPPPQARATPAASEAHASTATAPTETARTTASAVTCAARKHALAFVLPSSTIK